MQHLGQQLGRELSHSWLGLSSVCSQRDYMRFSEQPKSALRGETL